MADWRCSARHSAKAGMNSSAHRWWRWREGVSHWRSWINRPTEWATHHKNHIKDCHQIPRGMSSLWCRWCDIGYEIWNSWAKGRYPIRTVCRIKLKRWAILVLNAQYQREGRRCPSTTLIGRQGMVAARATSRSRSRSVPFDHFDHGLGIRWMVLVSRQAQWNNFAQKPCTLLFSVS